LRLTPQNMRLVGGCARGAEVAASASTFESSCVQSLVRACWSRRHIELLTCFLGSTASGSGVNPSVRHGSFTYGESASGGGGRSCACAVPSWRRLASSLENASCFQFERRPREFCKASQELHDQLDVRRRRALGGFIASAAGEVGLKTLHLPLQLPLLGRATHLQQPECGNRALEVLRFMINQEHCGKAGIDAVTAMCLVNHESQYFS